MIVILYVTKKKKKERWIIMYLYHITHWCLQILLFKLNQEKKKNNAANYIWIILAVIYF